MSRLILRTFGAKEWQTRLGHMIERTEDARPVQDMIYRDILRIEEEIFASGGRRGGGSWRGLAPATISSKLRKGQSPQILVATERLRESLTIPDDPLQIKRIGINSMTFGTRHPGARALQFGSEHVPARPYIRFTLADRARWRRWTADWILGRA